MDGLPGFRTAGFVRAVVHDGHARVNDPYEGFCIGQVEAVVIDQEKIDGADEVVGADEGDFFGLGEVAEIEEAEFAEADEDAGGAGILSGVEIPVRLGGAVGVGLGLDAGNGSDVFAVGGEDENAEPRNVNGVAGTDDTAGMALDSFEIGGVIAFGVGGELAVFTVVDEFADLDVLNEVGHAADVIDVEVRDENVIDLCDAGVLHGGFNADSIAAVVAGPAGVDEQ